MKCFRNPLPSKCFLISLNFFRKYNMKTVFLGNHDVGIQSLTALLDSVDVVGVVAHPLDAEEGFRFGSLFDFAVENNIPVIRGSPKQNTVLQFIKNFSPDLLWVTNYRYILPGWLTAMPVYGAINLHPSLLPKYRGRAPINWAILNGETEIGLTAHYIDEDIDSGDIINQIKVTIDNNHDIGDALRLLMPLYSRITRNVVSSLKLGTVMRKAQDLSQGSIFPARSIEDGCIDWSNSAENIRNLVRSVSHPYYGAFSKSQYGRITIWKARVADTEKVSVDRPGTIVDVINENIPRVQCGVGLLEILDYTLEDSSNWQLNAGDCLI